MYCFPIKNSHKKIEKSSVIHFTKTNNEQEGITNDQIYSILQDDEKFLWVGTDIGLNCIKYSLDKNAWIVDNSDFPNTLQKERVVEIFQDKDGDLWFGVKNGYLHKYVKGKKKFEVFTNPDLYYIQTIAQDSSGYLWFGSWQHPGLIKYDKQKNEFFKIETPSETSQPIDKQLIFDIFVDHNNRLWVATFGSGIYVYDPNKYQFDTFNFGKYKNEITGGSFIFDFLEDRNGRIWIVTKGNGIYLFDSKSGTMTNYSHNPNDPNSISSNSGLSIYEDLYGNLWIGTEWGLNKFIPSINGFEKFYRIGDERNNPRHISNNWIHAVQQDKEGTYWVATFYGLNRIYPQTGKVDHYWQDPKEPNFGGSIIVYNIFIDHQDILWVSTFGGLFLVDEDKRCLKRFYVFPDSTFTHNQVVNNFLEDRSDNLWLGTRSGLIKLDRERKITAHYTQKDGLPSNIINSILEDKYGNLWIGTTKGLTRFNPLEDSFRNFDMNDGLPGMAISENAAWKSRTGLLYFGIDKEILIVNPDNLVENSIIPSVHITSLELLKSKKKVDQIFSKSAEIILDYNENDFLLKFVAINYTNSNKNQYAYKLEGLDDNWVSNNDRRFVSYANVPPGSYVFYVKASNNDGVWNEKGTSLIIIITPPWWATWWFRVIVFLIILGIGYSIHLYRLNRVRELERLRIQIASDLHDEIGSALTKIAVHSEIIGTTTEKSKVVLSSQKIGNMSREIITTLSDVVWSIDSRNDTVGDLIDRMRDFLETVFPAGSIHIDFQTQGLHFDQKITQTFRQNIYLIFKEAVNNAAKHSGADEIKISLINDDGKFKMDITDNGTGIESIEKHSGHHVLENMQMRAKRIGGELRIEEPERGTCVTLIAKNI